VKRLFLTVLVLLLGWTALGQADFDTGFISLPAEALTAVPEFNAFEFRFTNTSDYFGVKKITDFNKVTVANFREPVDMAAALQTKASMQKSTFDLSRLQNEFGLGNNEAYTSDGATRVKNTVYKQQVGLDLMSPCPPNGICSRCAPYRVGRGF